MEDNEKNKLDKKEDSINIVTSQPDFHPLESQELYNSIFITLQLHGFSANMADGSLSHNLFAVPVIPVL